MSPCFHDYRYIYLICAAKHVLRKLWFKLQKKKCALIYIVDDIEPVVSNCLATT